MEDAAACRGWQTDSSEFFDAHDQPPLARRTAVFVDLSSAGAGEDCLRIAAISVKHADVKDWLSARFFGLVVEVCFVSTAMATADESVFDRFHSWTIRHNLSVQSAADLADGITLAQDRAKVLRELMRTDPQAAIAQAIPEKIRSALPPEITSELETHLSGVGEFSVIAVDGDEGGGFARYAWLNGRKYRARVFGRAIEMRTTGRAILQGVALGDELAVSSISRATEPAGIARYSWSKGTKQVLVIRIDFSDLAGDPRGDLDHATYTAAYVKSLLDEQVRPFYESNSYGLTSLSATASPKVYRMPQSSAYYVSHNANEELFAHATAAAGSDFTLENYDRIIVLFSRLQLRGDTDTQSVVYGGLSDVGGPRTWINGRFTFGYLAHELGHTYGLYHASLWQVSDGNPISPDGTNAEYGDDFDIMGHSGNAMADFNPWFKHLLGWIPSAQVQTVTQSGTYRINRFDNGIGAGTLALKIRKDATRNYWIACRRKFTTNSSLQNGAYVLWGKNEAAESQLLDMTTPGQSDQDAALAIGAKFTDTTSGISLQPTDQGGSMPNEYIDIAVTVPPASESPGLANISTRAAVGTGENVAVAGFIITGTAPKRVMIRGLGPSLGAQVPGVLTDPVLQLHDAGGRIIANNDNWRENANAAEINDSGLVPNSDSEAALLQTLAPGSYTAAMRGANDGSGIGLVEVYDLDPASASQLANISTRSFVQTDDRVMIGGLIVRSGTVKTVIVRAIGPSLGAAGIQHPLADPMLELRDNNGALLASNDNWQTDQRLDVEGSTLPPTQDAESAIVATFDPGNYTAIVRGKNGATGVGLIEVYDLP